MRKDIIKVTKRENNSKRSYLILNTNQCKYNPTSPSVAMSMFDELVYKIDEAYSNDGKTLFIGFAETATAIGFHVANRFGAYYLTTTRENNPNHEYIYFQEEHSHAVDQRIDKSCLDKLINRIERIIFIEDEVTTGNTISNAIKAIEKVYNRHIEFGIASLFNLMDYLTEKSFTRNNINVLYLAKIEVENDYKDVLNGYNYIDNTIEMSSSANRATNFITHSLTLKQKQNRGIFNTTNFLNQFKPVLDKIDFTDCKRICVLGTEEFMYPAIYLGNILEQKGYEVYSHATTRCPIQISSDEDYPMHSRYKFKSLYGDYDTYIYNLDKYDKVIIVSDYTNQKNFGALIDALIDCNNTNIDVIHADYEYDEMHSTYSTDDVTILLKDITNQMELSSVKEFENGIQSGIHYSEMLAVEYNPTLEYIKIYNEMLNIFKQANADAIAILSNKLYKLYGDKLVLVSLARAGLPIGILVKKYIENKYHCNISHYDISIIRGKGIDKVALDYILERHFAHNVQFIDGWTGKGAIKYQLEEALKEYPNISNKLAVIADPANITDLCGTHDDILIPSSCLNATISGLISRTVLRSDLIGNNDFHGAFFFKDLIDKDLSNSYIDEIVSCFDYTTSKHSVKSKNTTGMEDVEKIQRKYNIEDINYIKPGIGETTRVLLRRIPDVILINNRHKNSIELQHIIRLANDKNVDIEYVNMKCYKCCGIIKNLHGEV